MQRIRGEPMQFWVRRAEFSATIHLILEVSALHLFISCLDLLCSLPLICSLSPITVSQPPTVKYRLVYKEAYNLFHSVIIFCPVSIFHSPVLNLSHHLLKKKIIQNPWVATVETHRHRCPKSNCRRIEWVNRCWI